MIAELNVVVASTNPVKAKAAEEDLRAIPEFACFAINVNPQKIASGVSDQPSSDKETLLGALNRAKNAKIAVPDSDLWIGLEGGIRDEPDGMWSVVWGVVLNQANQVGRAQPGTYRIPDEVAELIRNGLKLGTADDIVFNRHNSKQGDGSVGILTHGAVDRTHYYKLAITLATIPLINPNLYKPENIDELIAQITTN